jgi:hypothetical protein
MSTPYELRFKVLEMARDLAVSEYEQQNAVLWNLSEKIHTIIDDFSKYATTSARAEWLSEVEELYRQISYQLPRSPEPSEINEKAKELYEFVATK